MLCRVFESYHNCSEAGGASPKKSLEEMIFSKLGRKGPECSHIMMAWKQYNSVQVPSCSPPSFLPAFYMIQEKNFQNRKENTTPEGRYGKRALLAISFKTPNGHIGLKTRIQKISEIKLLERTWENWGLRWLWGSGYALKWSKPQQRDTKSWVSNIS